jgi:transcription elongation factor Elf1
MTTSKESERAFAAEDAEDEAKKDPKQKGRQRKFDEFECPTCSAHNPYGDGFSSGDEVVCGYCGQSFEVKVNADGELKLREN